MPASQITPKEKKKASKALAPKLDILFGGPLLLVPAVTRGAITGVEVYSPSNGHPVGAVFLPAVWFSDAELNDPQCARWPEADSFQLLDPHSYVIQLTQKLPRKSKSASFPVTSIPDTNHKVSAGRKLSHDWEVALSIQGNLSGWGSHRLMEVREGLYGGSDAPLAGSSVASMHRLTYEGVTAAEFHGLSKESKEYLRANIAKGGSLILTGEVPYQPTLLHERRAVDALAQLAGLDLHWFPTTPTPNNKRLMFHLTFCGGSAVLV